MSCPDENTLLAFVQGALRGDAAASVEAHLDACEACRRLLAEVARGTLPPPATSSPDDTNAPDANDVRSGEHVGRYTILARIGAGAMGVVYAAHDPELDRKVAIKLVHHAAAGSSGSARSRVQREAKAIARLSHPHVIAVYDVGTFRGEVFLTMELAPGGTLREAMARRAWGWRETLDVFLQAGRGLAAAHAVGIVHRDFKPDNVLFGADGRVRVCDFGLARDAHALHALVDGEAPTSVGPRGLDATATKTGMILGTPAYMAPEQMRAERTDARADVFAFSVALYEALYGMRPFDGDSLAALRTSIEDGRIGQSPSPRGLPAGIRACIVRGLAARAEDRWATMAELLAALERAAALPARRRPRWAVQVLAVVGAAVAVVGIVAATQAWFARDHGAPAPTIAAPTIAAPPTFDPRDATRLTFGHGCEEYPSFTPDGRTVVFDGAAGSDSHLFALDLESGATRQLTSDPGWQYAPSLSPDGHTVAFLTRRGDDKGTSLIPLDGSAPPRRIEASGVRPSFSPDGACVWAGHATAKCIGTVSGIVSRTLSPPAGFEVLAVRSLVDGRVLAQFLELTSRLPRGLAVYAPGKSDEPAWLTRETLEEVMLPTPDGRGVIVAHPTPAGKVDLWRLPLAGGTPEPIPRSDVQPTKGMAMSRAGDRIVWSNCGTNPDLIALQPAGGRGALVAKTIFPSAEWQDGEPSWIPGTKQFVASSDRSGRNGLWVLDRLNAQAARELHLGSLRAAQPSVSPQGDAVAFASPDGGIYVVPLDGSSAPKRLTDSAEDGSPAFSRDGKTIYFERAEGPRPRVYAVPAEGGGAAAPFLPPGTGAPATSARDDLLAYNAFSSDDGSGQALPMIVDLRTRRSRPVSPEIRLGTHPVLRFSPVTPRLAVLNGLTEILEIDLASGAVVGRFDAGADQINGMTYVDGEIVAARWLWHGDIWSATAPFR